MIIQVAPRLVARPRSSTPSRSHRVLPIGTIPRMQLQEARRVRHGTRLVSQGGLVTTIWTGAEWRTRDVRFSGRMAFPSS